MAITVYVHVLVMDFWLFIYWLLIDSVRKIKLNTITNWPFLLDTTSTAPYPWVTSEELVHLSKKQLHWFQVLQKV